jgi:hypothetical protein
MIGEFGPLDKWQLRKLGTTSSTFASAGILNDKIYSYQLRLVPSKVNKHINHCMLAELM